MGNKGQYSYKFMIFLYFKSMIDLDRSYVGMYDWLENINRMESNTMTYGLTSNLRCRYFSIGLWGSLQTYFLLKCHPLKTLHVTSLYKEAIRHQNKMYGFWKKACGDIYAVLKLTYSMFQIRTGYRILFDHYSKLVLTFKILSNMSIEYLMLYPSREGIIIQLSSGY